MRGRGRFRRLESTVDEAASSVAAPAVPAKKPRRNRPRCGKCRQEASQDHSLCDYVWYLLRTCASHTVKVATTAYDFIRLTIDCLLCRFSIAYYPPASVSSTLLFAIESCEFVQPLVIVGATHAPLATEHYLVAMLMILFFIAFAFLLNHCLH